MAKVHSTEVITYECLDFLGFADYWVGDDGSVYSTLRTGLQTEVTTYEIAEAMRARYATGELTYEQLGKEFGVTHWMAMSVIVRKTWVEPVWKRLKEIKSKRKEYRRVSLCNENGVEVWQVHRLVLEAFVGPRPEGMEACHFPDRNLGNNRADNLRWDTPESNQADRKDHGTDMPGEKHPLAVLTDDDVYEMRRRYDTRHKTGDSAKQIAIDFNMSRSQTYWIVRRKGWKHLPETA